METRAGEGECVETLKKTRRIGNSYWRCRYNQCRGTSGRWSQNSARRQGWEAASKRGGRERLRTREEGKVLNPKEAFTSKIEAKTPVQGGAGQQAPKKVAVPLSVQN
ncbi:MAG: uncharacterized protein A8A55_2524 [Amphiamblys sp. WSBS2006]|nr:MAG: uncharacterized protein A8A55_2524 [Amphiamblys sp. WSBS2006]